MLQSRSVPDENVLRKKKNFLEASSDTPHSTEHDERRFLQVLHVS